MPLQFINQSGLPVMLESWQKVVFGLNTLSSQCIRDGEMVLLHSITGEWYLNTMFDDVSLCKDWRNQGFNHITLGKFTSRNQSMDQTDFCVDIQGDTIRFLLRS